MLSTRRRVSNTHVVLLDDLVEARVVELHKLGEVVDIGDDVAQVLLQQHELLFAGAVLAQAALVEPVDDIADLALADGDAARDLHGLDLLLGVHLVELGLEQVDEAALVVLGPLAARRLAGPPGGAVAGGRGRDGAAGPLLEVGLEPFIVDVVPLVLADQARPELLAELHDDDTGGGSPVGVAGEIGAAAGFGVRLEVLDNQHRAGQVCSSQQKNAQRPRHALILDVAALGLTCEPARSIVCDQACKLSVEPMVQWQIYPNKTGGGPKSTVVCARGAARTTPTIAVPGDTTFLKRALPLANDELPEPSYFHP